MEWRIEGSRCVWYIPFSSCPLMNFLFRCLYVQVLSIWSSFLPCVDSAQMQNMIALFWWALLDHHPSGPYDLYQMKVLQLRGPSARAYLPGALQKKLCPQILRGLLWLWIASVKKGKTISRPSHRPDWRRDCCSLGLTVCAHPRLSISAPKWTCRRCRNESGPGSKGN